MKGKNTLSIDTGHELLVSVDTLVGGVHFPPDTGPFEVGYKALAVNLSDIAAMGAEPAAVAVTLTLPREDQAWLQDFNHGFHSLASRFSLPLPDILTTVGHLSVTVQIYGTAPRGQALRRSTARPEDWIYVTGSLGDAGVALRRLLEGLDLEEPHRSWLESRLNRPEPRIGIGRALRGIASSAIDISDGLIPDLGHILEQSHVGATVDTEKLPLSPQVLATVGRKAGLRSALAAGDDYELCSTLPPERTPELERIQNAHGCPLTYIGRIEQEPGLRCLRSDGSALPPIEGYEHFT